MRIALFLLAFVATDSIASEFESRYISSVFSGDLSWVADAEPKQASALALKAKFNERFLLRTESVEIAGLDDPVVSAIIRRYQDYWREALLLPSGIEDAERRLAADVARLIALDGFAADLDDLDSALGELFARRDFDHRGGRTPPLLDFMLWRDTRSASHDIELTDTSQEVIVHYLSDFIVRGWSHFATFDRSGTGGWADRDSLYCISDAYDLDSEDFKNSYLRHEARHFADYARYPKLHGADLEYRGKLTELAFSTDALRLVHKFHRHGNGTSDAPHPLANWHVVQDIASTVSPTCAHDALECAKSVSNRDLQAAARHLLAEHSNKLEALGVDTVETTLEVAAHD